MPTNRFQFSDDFVLNNGNVGINSATPQEELDVVGVVRGDNLKVVGVSSFSGYEGFLNSNQNITENINLDANRGITGSLSGEIVVGTGLTITGIGSAVSGQGYIDSLKVYNTFTVPSGGTLDRPSKAKPGQLYYNRDFATIEFYNGTVWRQVDNTTQRGRAVFAGGYRTPGNNNKNSEFINIMSLGNALSFGDLVLNAKYSQSGASDGKRGLFIGGQSVSDIEYITIASEGNSIDFGDLTGSTGNHCGSLSSSTRAIRGGGYSGPGPVGINVMDYVQVQTLGNALDFGDLLEGNFGLCGFSNSTRGIFAGGRGVDTPLGQTRINQITIASTGNAISFGNLTEKHSYVAGLSNSIRGFICGGDNPMTNTIQYLTIATSGNTEDFGDLTLAKNGIASGNSANQVRGIFAGGSNSPTGGFNVIDYITIATAGNAQDFGDLTVARAYSGACSDSHGGLGGF